MNLLSINRHRMPLIYFFAYLCPTLFRRQTTRDKVPLEPCFVQVCPASQMSTCHFVRALSRICLDRVLFLPCPLAAFIWAQGGTSRGKPPQRRRRWSSGCVSGGILDSAWGGIEDGVRGGFGGSISDGMSGSIPVGVWGSVWTALGAALGAACGYVCGSPRSRRN